MSVELIGIVTVGVALAGDGLLLDFIEEIGR